MLAAQLDRCANPFFTPDAQLFSDLVDGNHYEFETSLFDGVAAIALAMNAADEDAAEGQEALSVGEKLRNKLLNVSFDGASGPVALDAQGDRDSTTIQFALESFGDPLSVEPLTLAYEVYEVFMNTSSTTFEMAATAAAPVQWIVGSEGPNSQPEDAITRKVLAPRNPSLHYTL